MGPTAVEFFPESRKQREVLRVDRALAAEMMVMLGNLEHPFPRDIPPTEHVFQERHHIIRPVRSTE
jgi:hypothetical protein